MYKFSAFFLCWVLLISPSAEAAVTFLSAGSGFAQATGTVTVSGLTTTGATLITACASSDGGTDGAAVVSDGSNTWTRIAQGATGGSNHASFWYTIPTVAVTSVSFSGSFDTLMIQSFSGTAASSVLDGAVTVNSGTNINSIQPGSITPAANGSLLSTCIALSAGTAQETLNSSFSISNDVALVGGTAYAGAFGYYIQPTAGAVNPTWSGADWASSNSAYTMMQSFAPAGGGGPTITPAHLTTIGAGP